MPSQTPSQTVGPFFSHALTPSGAAARMVPGNRLADDGTPGTAIRIEGMFVDGAGNPVPDGMIEIWQANDDGRYADGSRGLFGFGRAGTDTSGRYWFRTIKPGSVDSRSAPHINVAVFARGMLNHLFTRIYFSDEGEANAADRVLEGVDPARRETLVATRHERDGVVTYKFTVRLQGEQETVFFDA